MSHRHPFSTALFFVAVLGIVPTPASAQAVTLAWDPSAGATGYIVEYGTQTRDVVAYSTTVNVGSVTRWQFTPPSTVETYYFSVRAYNGSGQSALSSEVILEPTGSLPPPPGSGDVNADGHIDLLFHHATWGYVAAWYMNSTTMLSAVLLNAPPVTNTAWRVAATADLNGDGQRDIIWQNSSLGVITSWLMNGINFTATGTLSPNQVSNPDWQLAAAVDLTGDGKPDFVWRHKTQGWLSVWVMDGLKMVEGRALTPNQITDPNWELVGSGDFDLDGKPDLVWQNAATGAVTVWLMDGTQMKAPGLLRPNSVSDTNWRLVAVFDINGDGKPDLIWQHRDGYIAAWLMNGLTLIRATQLTPGQVNDLNWRIVGPR